MNRKMRKALSLLLAIIMVMSLVACGGKNNTANSGNDKTDTSNTQKDTSTEGKTSQGTKVEATESADAEYASEITIELTVGSLDPTDGWSATREGYQRLVFDNLIYIDDITGEETLMLAESVEWTDDTYTCLHIILKDYATFSNGDPVTTADVEYSFGRTTYGSFKKMYDRCEIISDTEMKVYLKQACAPFYNILSRVFTGIVCKAEAEKNPDGLALIGSGPFVYDMESYVAANSVTLVRNENYWNKDFESPTEKIHIVKIKDPSAAAIALQNGEINFGVNFNANELPQMEKDENLVVTTYNSLNFIYMCFNDHGDSTAVTEEEKNFRRAVACAVNKEDIIAGVDGGMVMTSMWPYDHAAYIANESDYEHDLSYSPEMANEYLAKAGGKTEFKVLVDTSRAWCKLAAMVMQEQCRAVGITMNIEETDSTGFTAASKWEPLMNSDYDANLWSTVFTIEFANWNHYTVGNNVNRALMNDPEIVAALEQVYTADEAAKSDLYKTMQTEVHNNVSYLPLIFREMNYAYTKGLENFEMTASPCYVLRNIRLRTN